MEPRLLTLLIVAPAVLVVIAVFLMVWNERTFSRTGSVAIVSGIVLAVWLTATTLLARSGFYLPPETRRAPPVAVQLVVALIGLALALAVSPSLRSLLTNQKQLLRLNVWRLVGAVFLALMITGQVPALWAVPAGTGDVLVGATAFWVARGVDTAGGRRRAIVFNLLGLLDLVVAIGLGTATSPGPTQIFHTRPTSVILTHFPLVLVPTFLVPLAVMVHVISLWQLWGGSWRAPGTTSAR